MFTGWSSLVEVLSKSKPFNLRNIICYDRIKGRGAKKNFVSTREEILFFSKSDTYTFHVLQSTIKKKTGGMGQKNGKECRTLSNVWSDISPIVPWSKERVKHPTQKPLQLMEMDISLYTFALCKLCCIWLRVFTHTYLTGWLHAHIPCIRFCTHPT